MSYAHGLRPEFRFPNGLYYGVSVGHASLRIIAHEHVRVLMTRGYVDDTLFALPGSGVILAV